MNWHTHRLFAAAALVGLLAGCGDAYFFGEEQPEETDTRKQRVSVVPEFSVRGAERLPEGLLLSEMDLLVSEIRLSPVEGSKDGLGYVTREPIHLQFKVADGETVQEREEIALPKAGLYEISLRLEPAARAARQEGNYSVSFSGHLPVDRSLCTDPRADQGSSSDGDPVPNPFGPDNQIEEKHASPKRFAKFNYTSDKSVIYHLERVRLYDGAQILSFAFDIGEWVRELRRPIGRALQKHDCPGTQRTNPGGYVDVTKEIDRFGEGPETMGEHMSVKSRRTNNSPGL